MVDLFPQYPITEISREELIEFLESIDSIVCIDGETYKASTVLKKVETSTIDVWFQQYLPKTGVYIFQGKYTEFQLQELRQQRLTERRFRLKSDKKKYGEYDTTTNLSDFEKNI